MTPSAVPPEAIPDWLRDLQGEIGEPQAAQSSSTQPSTLRIRQPIGATDWLRSLGVDEEQPRSEESEQEESPSVAEEDEDLPDEVERHITGMLPDVLTDELEQEIERVETLQLENLPSDQYPDEDYPETSNEPYTPASPPASDEPQPFNIDDILAGEAPPDDSGSWVGSGPTIPMNIEEDMPAWMQDESSDFPSAETDESSSAMEMPNWLSSLGGGGEGEDEEEMTAGSQASSPPPPIDAESDEGSVPDWLFSGNEPEDTTGDSGVPDWLSGMGGGDEDDTQPAAVTDTADDSGVPDWLSGMGGGDEDDTQPAAVADTADDSGVPDWLSGMGGGDEDDTQPAAVTDTADDSGVPDWLSGMGGGR